MSDLINMKHELLHAHSSQRGPDALALLALMRTAALIERSCAERLAPFGLTENKLALLLALDADGSQTPAQLAEKLEVTRAAVTGLLDGLEQDRLLQRTTRDTDRRSFSVQLTPEGRARLRQVAPAYDAWLSELIAGVASTHIRHTMKVLQKIQQNLSVEG